MDYIFFPYSQIAGWYGGSNEVVLNIFEIQLILHLRTKDCEEIVQLLDSYSNVFIYKNIYLIIIDIIKRKI